MPHLTYDEAAKGGLLDDIEFPSTLPNADPDAYPPSFLTPDDIDNYLFEIDSRIGGPGSSLPTLAPLAHHGRRAAELAGAGGPSATGTNGHSAQNVAGLPITAPASSSSSYQLRNPASVYNWLRKHSPQVFLQDGEKDGRGDGGDGHHAEKPAAKSRTPASRGGTRTSKRASTKAPRASSMDMEVDDEDGGGTPAPSTTNRGRRKRVADDDTGYRPKGGSSRPAKKKRKNEGVDTPTLKRPRKTKKELSDEIVREVDVEAGSDGVGDEN